MLSFGQLDTKTTTTVVTVITVGVATSGDFLASWDLVFFLGGGVAIGWTAFKTVSVKDKLLRDELIRKKLHVGWKLYAASMSRCLTSWFCYLYFLQRLSFLGKAWFIIWFSKVALMKYQAVWLLSVRGLGTSMSSRKSCKTIKPFSNWKTQAFRKEGCLQVIFRLERLRLFAF